MREFKLPRILLSVIALALIINFFIFNGNGFDIGIAYINQGWTIAGITVLLYIILVSYDPNVRLAMFLILPWVFLELIGRHFFDVYRTFPPIDIISHFFSGMGVAAILYLIYNHDLKWTLFYSFLIALTGEVIEIFFDYAVQQPPWLKDCIFCFDGLKDTIFFLSGAFLMWTTLVHLKIRK